MPQQKRPLRISAPQLAKFGLELVRRDPLVIRCAICGVEWRPVRLPRLGHLNNSWRCQNGCHQLKE
jgi:hypothetical protein